MITPGLIRRSLGRAAQWRLLLLQLLLLAIAGWIASQPFSMFLQKELGHLPGAKALMPALGGRVVLDLIGQMMGPESTHPELGIAAGLVLALIFGAFFTGAVLTVAQEDEAPRSRALLAGAGAWFGRMIRTLFFGFIPYGIAGGATAALFHWSGKAGERALTEASANHAMHVAAVNTLVLFFLATLWLDAARAMFVAWPARRSAFFAVFAGGLLFLRRPLRAIAIGIGTLGLSYLLAALAIIWRQRIVQASGGKVFGALLLAQLALVLLAWGRAARLIAFVELARADQLARRKPDARPAASTSASAIAFEMAPPRTSPPPVASAPSAIIAAPSPLPDAFRSLPTAPEAAPVQIVAVATIAAVAIEVPEPELLPSAPPPAIAAVPSGGGTGSAT